MSKQTAVDIEVIIQNAGAEYYETSFLEGFFDTKKVVGITYGDKLEAFLGEVQNQYPTDRDGDALALLFGFIEQVLFKFDVGCNLDGDDLRLSGRMAFVFNGDMKDEHIKKLNGLVSGMQKLFRVPKFLHSNSELFYVITEQMLAAADPTDEKQKSLSEDKKRFIRHSQFLNEIIIKTI